jgi:hypothetical protein
MTQRSPPVSPPAAGCHVPVDRCQSLGESRSQAIEQLARANPRRLVHIFEERCIAEQFCSCPDESRVRVRALGEKAEGRRRYRRPSRLTEMAPREVGSSSRSGPPSECASSQRGRQRPVIMYICGHRLMKFFHLSGAILENGSVISPGNWGRIIKQLGWQHGRSVFEVALDDQRLRNFSGLPSRLEASFYFDDVGEARFYRNAQNLNTHVLYEIDLLDPGATQHRTDWRNISPSGPLDNDWTRRYWAPVFQPPHESGHVCREVFAITPLRVVERLPF